MAKILITGGSGLIGKAVSELLLKKQHQLVWLSRQAGEWNGIKKYKWDIDGSYVDERAFEGVEHVIHLAGSGIADKRWTTRYKQEIIDSRTKSSALLFRSITQSHCPVKVLAGASAVGYYGARQSPHIFTETDFAGTDFLANVCRRWEQSYTPFAGAGIRTVILRAGMVLSAHGGLYKKLQAPFRLGLGAGFGSGKQYVPWIHINDMAAAYVHALLNPNVSGIYNATAPELVTNSGFSTQLAQSFGKPLFLPRVPKGLLSLVLGESAAALTEGLKISDRKMIESGFKFEFDTLSLAFDQLRA